MLDAEATLADRTSSILNVIAIILTIAIATTTFAATLAVATDRWTKTVRAILAGMPGLLMAVLALLNPRVDWHRKKEIDLNAIVLAVRYQGMTVSEASKLYAELRRNTEAQWQKNKGAEKTPPDIVTTQPGTANVSVGGSH